jgi:hypothetical protein
MLSPTPNTSQTEEKPARLSSNFSSVYSSSRLISAEVGEADEGAVTYFDSESCVDSDMETELDAGEDDIRKPATRISDSAPLPEIALVVGTGAIQIATPAVESPVSGAGGEKFCLPSPVKENFGTSSPDKKYIEDPQANPSDTAITYNYRFNSRSSRERIGSGVYASFDENYSRAGVEIEDEEDNDPSQKSNVLSASPANETEIKLYSCEVPKISSNNGVTGAKSRCSRVVLAGVLIQRGMKASLFSKCACDNLRCMHCNFQVKCFRGVRWRKEVDYMFFRNNVMSDGKLSTALTAAAESFAYCCQCSWIDTQVVLVPVCSSFGLNA